MLQYVEFSMGAQTIVGELTMDEASFEELILLEVQATSTVPVATAAASDAASTASGTASMI